MRFLVGKHSRQRKQELQRSRGRRLMYLKYRRRAVWLHVN